MPQIRQTPPNYSKETILSRIFQPIDIAALAYFRIVFGAIMLWEVWRYFDGGRIERYYIDPTFHFTYYGFEWVKPWAGDGMYLHFYALGALALCIILGLGYRVTASLFFLGFTYVFLLEQANYLNHFYLISLISLLMIFVPAHRALSIDALLRPKIRSETAPAWALWLLRAQIGIVYFFGGVAKLNYDWLRGEPMRMWLAERTDFPVIGSLFTEEWMVFSFAYGALLIDLLAFPLLLWRRTRLPMVGILVAFHLMNAELFSIGIFPWFMIAATLIFFAPEWPRRILNLIRRSAGTARSPSSGQSRKKRREATTVVSGRISLNRLQTITVVLLVIFLAAQVSIPMRHHLYPGYVSWTEEGHNFSWHMKLRDKESEELKFYVMDPVNGETVDVDPWDDLSSRQVSKMSTRPDLILQYSHYLADRFRQQGYEEVEVHVWAMVSLNGREPQLMIDPEVDLAAQPRNLLPATWIMPLKD